MKKFIAVAAALMVLAGATQAQDSTRHAGKHGKGAQKKEWAQHKLNLTEAQKAEFKKLNESFRQQAAEIRNNTALSKEEQKTRLQSLHKAQREKAQSLLTAEQKAQIASLAKDKKSHGDKMAKHRKGGHGKGFAKGQDLERIKSDLKLSEEQVSRLKANQEQFKTKARAIRENEKLSAEQKKAEFKALAEQRKESMKSILTPEQQEKIKSFRKDRKQVK